ncbi:MAG: hypothetical protein ACKESA_00680 [Candidatus Hodgkinia cicadicola]
MSNSLPNLDRCTPDCVWQTGPHCQARGPNIRSKALTLVPIGTNTINLIGPLNSYDNSCNPTFKQTNGPRRAMSNEQSFRIDLKPNPDSTLIPYITFLNHNLPTGKHTQLS